jgi:amino acid permease
MTTSNHLSRKFILAVLVVLCATGLCAFGKIDATAYAAIVGGVVAAYLAANVTQKAVA